jgi:CRISPR-associated exonuclease Cas4
MNGASLLLVLALLLLAAGLGLVWRARRARRSTGLPRGQIVYSDTGAEQAVLQPLVSHRYGLVGKPDYLVEVAHGKGRMVVPLEVKSRRQPPAPHRGHLLQLATYCLLVEDVYGVRPPHGYLRYADATLAIPFSNELRQAVIDAAAGIRRARAQADVRRSHQEPALCAACGYTAGCGADALVGVQARKTQP